MLLSQLYREKKMSYREIFTEAYNEVKKEESKQKPYVSSSNGVFSVLDADGKEAYKSSSYTLAQDYFKKNYDKLKEESDHEISMARGELEAIADKATQLAGALQGKSDEGNPLEAWVQSKITKAKDYINSVSDYLMYNPDMKQNEETEVNEKTYGWTLVSKAKDLAKKFANNMTKAVAEIEKLEKGLSDNPVVYKELLKYNEEVELEEGKIKDIFTANKEGESVEDIAKRLKLSVSTVKNVLGEEIHPHAKKMAKDGVSDEKIKKMHPEITDDELKSLKEEDLQELSKAERDKRIQRAKDMIKYYDAQKKAALKGPNKALAKKMLKNETELEEVTQKEIDKFHTDLDNLVHKTFGHSSDEKKKEKMNEKVADSIIKDLQKAYEPMKGKTISPQMATKISKHLDGQSYDVVTLRQLMKADIPFISTIARNKIYKKTGKFEQTNLEEKRLFVEAIAGLKKKAEKKAVCHTIY
jgi:hypothetical protein